MTGLRLLASGALAALAGASPAAPGAVAAEQSASNATAGLAAQLSASVSASYSGGGGLTYAYLAQSAICPGIAQAWDCGPCRHVTGVTDVRPADNADLGTHSFVAKRGGQCILAFRGTDSVQGWIQDLKSMALVEFPGCSFQGTSCGVGAGFWQDYSALAPQIKAELQSIGCGKDTPIAITGHSLGGALTMVAALDLKSEGYNVETVYTFGSPRVGDSTFANAFKQKLGSVAVFRVTNADDPIPLLPPKDPFEHVGQEVFYTNGASFKLCGGHEDQACSDGYHNSLFWMIMQCTLDVQSCGHMTYFAPQLPFETQCQGGSVLLP